LTTLEIAQAAIEKKADVYAKQVAEFGEKVREKLQEINEINARIFTSKDITLAERNELRNRRAESTKAKTAAEIALMKAKESLAYCDKHMRRVSAQHLESDARYHELRNGYARTVADLPEKPLSSEAEAALKSAREGNEDLSNASLRSHSESTDLTGGEPVAPQPVFSAIVPSREDSLYNKPSLTPSRWRRFRRWLFGY
jgi:hypothetical protein